MVQSFHNLVFGKYADFKENAINQRRFKHHELVEILNKHKSNSVFKFSIAGKSIEEREIYHITYGHGPIQILIWSQMHGNEPTGTMALFDLLNFFATANSVFPEEIKTIQKSCTIHLVPMLNPDGAERFTRRNAIQVDLNRDAQSLISPESMILKILRDQTKAEFGFNLHDQELYYSAGNTGKPATIAFLAPSFNAEKAINLLREKSMKLIVAMHDMLQNYIPYHVARYNDDFVSTAFGDNIQKWGTSTILIEAGYYPEDTERQFVRKLNFLALIFGIHQIATKEYLLETTKDYFQIPNNRKDAFFDIIIRKATLIQGNNKFVIDIGISRDKADAEDFTDYSTDYRIWNIGDLSNYFCFKDIDAKGLIIKETDNPFALRQKANFELVNEKGTVYKIIDGIITKTE